MQDKIRSELCVKMLDRCKDIAGDIAECGVAFGQTTFMLDDIAFKIGKKVYAFDTFSGLPYDDQIVSEHQCKRGEMDYGEAFFSKLDERKYTAIIPVKGLIEDTLKEYANKKFCFVWLDLDLYQATACAYKFFEDRVSAGGIIGFHDYRFHRCPGVEIVVDKEVDRNKYEIISNESTCLFLRRR